MLEWKERFSVCNEELDRQHQKLFDLVNEILEAMKTEKSNDEVFIDRVLGELYDYTQYHFRSEEKAFIGTDYPFLREHIKAHIEFTETVKKMVAEKTKIGASLNAIRIAHAASTWIIQHVIRFDRGYARYLINKKDNQKVLPNGRISAEDLTQPAAGSAISLTSAAPLRRE